VNPSNGAIHRYWPGRLSLLHLLRAELKVDLLM
jgi:hypothetical protein